jgi:cell division protein FtsB
MGRIQSEILLNQKELEQINLQLKQAKDPSFIERQARDKLDYANENDLVFVFAEE